MKSKLIPCKACGKMVAKSASKCPDCGAAKTNVARMLLLVILATLIGLFFIRGILSL